MKESKREKALSLLLDWAIECGFGFDNLGDGLYEKYEQDIKEMKYKDGLIYIAEKIVEKREKHKKLGLLKQLCKHCEGTLNQCEKLCPWRSISNDYCDEYESLRVAIESDDYDD